MDITYTIGGVPCRPQKNGFFRRNAVDDLFADAMGTKIEFMREFFLTLTMIPSFNAQHFASLHEPPADWILPAFRAGYQWITSGHNDSSSTGKPCLAASQNQWNEESSSTGTPCPRM